MSFLEFILMSPFFGGLVGGWQVRIKQHGKKKKNAVKIDLLNSHLERK